MFDLEKAIENWRHQMLNAGVKTPVPLDELESHLREDMEQQIHAGLGEPEAFETASKRIGPASVLNAEFKKVEHGGQVFRRKMVWKNKVSMKKYRSHVIIGCLWVCLGFTLCYFSGVSHATSKHADAKTEMKRMVQAVDAYNAGGVRGIR